MNTQKNIDYSSLYVGIDKAIAADLPQMELYLELGRLVSDRPENGAAVMAAEYISANYPECVGFSPRNLRRMRDFYRMYEGYPKILVQAMKIGWTQNVVIMEADLYMDACRWYLLTVQKFGWSKAELAKQIARNAHLDESREGDASTTEYESFFKVSPVQSRTPQNFVDNVVAFMEKLWYNKSWEFCLFRQAEVINGTIIRKKTNHTRLFSKYYFSMIQEEKGNMDLTQAIQHILDGNAVILMGAGASYGAKNPYGDFPSGYSLAASLYKACDINAVDQSDLQDAAQSYLEQFSAESLIQEIKAQLTCTSFLPCHTTIYSQPWMRYYTTNYDDLAFCAARNNGVMISSIPLSASFKKNIEKDRLCIHINGYIGNLNEVTLLNEFKLTSDSYLSTDSILSSTWGALLRSDLEAAKCVVILGLSLKYDLDLSRIIFNSACKTKTVIIDSPTLEPDAERRLARFGDVYKIGIEGFASEINQIADSYTPKVVDPVNMIYSCFEHEYHRRHSITPPQPADVYRLFLNGTYTSDLFFKTNGDYDGFVSREKTNEIRNAIITQKKKYVFILADMGNGKTSCIEQLREELAKEDIHIFTFYNFNLSHISSEISALCSINTPCVVIIDDYVSYMDILRGFATRPHPHLQFVFTARTAANYSRLPDVFSMFSIEENESFEIRLDNLTHTEIEHCITLFDRYGAWGKKSGLSHHEKVRYLKSKRSGASRFQSIMIDVLKSDDMIQRIEKLVDTIQEQSLNYHHAVIMILIAQVMQLNIYTSDFEAILKQSILTDAKFRNNPAILELLTFQNGKKCFAIKSPITARIILSKISDPKMVVDALFDLAQYAIQYQMIPRYKNILSNIISYSHISSFLRESQGNFETLLSNYYDKLGELEYYRTSNFFWLQYAISCIEIAEYERAQRYIDTAYGLAGDDFIPFQINNQQARLYLEKIFNAKSTDKMTDFKEAHRLLMLQIRSEKDNEFNVVKLFGYYVRKEFYQQMDDESLRAFHQTACKEAFERLQDFTKRNSVYQYMLSDLSRRLMLFALSLSEADA